MYFCCLITFYITFAIGERTIEKSVPHVQTLRTEGDRHVKVCRNVKKCVFLRFNYILIRFVIGKRARKRGNGEYSIEKSVKGCAIVLRKSEVTDVQVLRRGTDHATVLKY